MGVLVDIFSLFKQLCSMEILIIIQVALKCTDHQLIDFLYIPMTLEYRNKFFIG